VNKRLYGSLVSLIGGLFALLDVRRTVLGLEHVPTKGPFVLAISHFSYVDFAFVGLARQRWHVVQLVRCRVP